MKKLLLVFSIVGLLSFSSCSKCQTCTFSGGDSEEVCEDDFPGGNAFYKAYIDALEAQGYECKK